MAVTYWHWNIHRTNASKLEAMLNAHADKGYELHHIRGIGGTGNEHLLVVFKRAFKTASDRDRYRADHDQRHTAVVAQPTA